MGNSLSDALTKAGVVSTGQAKIAAQHAKKQQRQELHAQRTKNNPILSDAAIAALKSQEEKLRRDQELNRVQEEARLAKAARSQVRQILNTHLQNDDSAEVMFNFVEGKHIRHIYLNETQREQIIAGKIAIVAFAERHYLVAPEIAYKVQTLIPEIFIYCPTPEKNPIAPDDPYSDYPVPDDLMW